MKTIKYVLLLVAVAILSGVAADQFVEAQTIEVTKDINLDTNQVIIVIIIGVVGGVVRAWQGYDKSPNDFDTLLFINGIRNAVLASIPIALASALTTELNAFGYVMIFLGVVGTTNLASNTMKKSIPSNATPEEIQRILDERD